MLAIGNFTMGRINFGKCLRIPGCLFYGGNISHVRSYSCIAGNNHWLAPYKNCIDFGN